MKTSSPLRRGRSALPAHALLLGMLAGCGAAVETVLPARTATGVTDPNGATLLARFVQFTDTHVMDEESPARFAGAYQLTHSAWRPWEAASAQLVDGVIRHVNALQADGRNVDFLVHTGDLTDTLLGVEFGWGVTLFDGGVLNPRTGPDDRDPNSLPPTDLDPYASFVAAGLYQSDVHGTAASIPWYYVFGNHDVYAIGVFPVITAADGTRRAPLPFSGRPGFVLPTYLDPLASEAYGNVTPAEPGPPDLFNVPRPVTVNPARRYASRDEVIATLLDTATFPLGHGFADAPDGATWYSTSPAPGIRLIGLDTTDATNVIPAGLYVEGAISRRQLAFLRTELAAAEAANEWVIVASHHPSDSLTPLAGSEVLPIELQATLRACPRVVLHIAGHRHRNYVLDRGDYIEIETASTIDPPHEARLIELWQQADGTVAVSYEPVPSITGADDDELAALRRWAVSQEYPE